jgi:transposase InsO family protein
VHVMIDDHSRLAYAEVLDGLTASCAVAFLRRAIAWFAERGVRVEAVMSDNGSCYVAHEYAAALNDLSLRHLRIKPGRPRTNGKAARFIRTLLNEWAYERIYGTSEERTATPLRQDGAVALGSRRLVVGGEWSAPTHMSWVAGVWPGRATYGGRRP